MDRATLEAYDRNAASFAEDWEAQPSPDDIYDIVRRCFRQGKTAHRRAESLEFVNAKAGHSRDSSNSHVVIALTSKCQSI
jgi:hypothetical protein